MFPLGLVMVGGALGAGARYLFGAMMLRVAGIGFPWGTMGVNLVGGLLMGLLVAFLGRSAAAGGESLRLLVGVGVLGGFTTFSSFGLETVLLFDRGRALSAIAYIVVSVAGTLIALQLGRLAGRAIS